MSISHYSTNSNLIPTSNNNKIIFSTFSRMILVIFKPAFQVKPGIDAKHILSLFCRDNVLFIFLLIFFLPKSQK